ncbi:MAG: hypothetical protein ACKVPX_09545 [Myxococcaceae bacterium]
MSPLFVGDATKKPERVTFHAPSRLLLALAGVTMAGALALYVSGRREAGVFVGLWPLGMLSMGNYIREMKRVGADPPQGAF